MWNWRRGPPLTGRVTSVAVISTSEQNDLPDSAFAYIESGGSKDKDGKTVPRSLRHFPVHDAAHVRNALARASQSPFGDKAMGKIKAAAKKFGVHVGENSAAQDYELRELRITSLYRDLSKPVEYRDMGADGKWIGGYATVFMPRESKNLGGFVERIAPYCFDEARAGNWEDVVCRYNHDSNMVLGTTAASTCRIVTDRIGLDYMVRPPEARTDIRELVQRGDIRYSSFAFRVTPGGDEWGVDERNFPLRTLHNVELIDVAPVLSPGYPDATAAVRATQAAIESAANWAQASADEVRSLANDGELRKLFIRTDRPATPAGPRKGLFGPVAASLLLQRAKDPYDTSQ
jgi:HK97 family phage prohead protease